MHLFAKWKPQIVVILVPDTDKTELERVSLSHQCKAPKSGTPAAAGREEATLFGKSDVTPQRSFPPGIIRGSYLMFPQQYGICHTAS